MIGGRSAALLGALASGTFTYDVRVSSWLGGRLLADSVPIDEGTETCDRSLKVPEYVRLTIPKRTGETLWVPDADDHPLNANGQTLKVSLGVGVAGAMEWFQRGEFLINNLEVTDKTVTVTAVGLLALIQEAVFVAPFQPSGTIASTVRDLLEPAVSVNLDNAPTDRAVPAGINWDSDRIQALYDLLDAWPAVPFMNEQGYLAVYDDDIPTEPYWTFTDGVGGTVVQAAGQATRDGGFNVVVATGNATDGTEVRGTAYVDTGAWAYPGGTANPLPVPFGYASPLLTTVAQCQAAATTVLRRKMRQSALRRFTVTAVPHPLLQVGDPVWVESVDFPAGALCTVETMGLPYKPGPMALTVVTTT